MKKRKYKKWDEIINPGLDKARTAKRIDPYKREIEKTLYNENDEVNEEKEKIQPEKEDNNLPEPGKSPVGKKEPNLDDYNRKTRIARENSIKESTKSEKLKKSAKSEIKKAEEEKKKKRKALGGLMDEWVSWKESQQK